MEVFTVSFFGHRHIEDHFYVYRDLEELVSQLLRDKAYVELLVGRDGEFDLLVSAAINKCKSRVRDDNSAHVWVMPYETADYRKREESYEEYYDEIEVFSGSHYKAAFLERNKSMVDRSHLVIFFVERKRGGAYRMMDYAEKNGKPYINLADKYSGVSVSGGQSENHREK